MMLACIHDVSISEITLLHTQNKHLHFQHMHAWPEGLSVHQVEDPESKRQKDMASSQLEKAKKSGHVHHT